MSYTGLALPLFCLGVSGLAAQSFLSNGVNRFAGVDTSTSTNIGDNGPAYNSTLTYPAGIARDAAGNLYIAEQAHIRKVDAAGNISTIAGNGVLNLTGDGGPATAAGVFYTANIILDSQGNIYFSEDQVNIRRIATDRTISTFAGRFANGYNGEGVPAVSAGISAAGLAVDAHDQIYFADPNNARVRVVRQDGKVYTVAGTGIRGSNGENGPALQAQLLSPSGVAFDAGGNLYVADGRRVVRIDPSGILTRIAGDPSLPFNAPAIDEVPATSTAVNAISVATDAAGNIFVGTPRIRKITPDGIIHAVAGIDNPLVPGFTFTEACGDALHASIYGIALVVDRTGNILVANTPAGRVQQITPDGRISTLAGAGPNRFSGDGGPATAATFASPSGLAFDASGNLYVADSGNNRIRMIDAGGMVSTVVGDGGPTYEVDSTCFPDRDDFLRNPRGIAFDGLGNLFIADAGKHRIRKIASDGTHSTVASPPLSYPVGVATDSLGSLYVADSGSAGVFKITPQGSVITLSKGGASGSLALDAAGNLLISAGHEVDRVGTDGSLSPVAGTGEYNTTQAPGFGNLSPPTEIANASAVVLDAAGSLYVADTGKGVIQRVSANCALSFAPLQASGLAFDSQGNLYAADGYHGIIWQSLPAAVPPSEEPTPSFGFNAFRSAAGLPFIQPYGEPPLPAYAPPIAPGELLDIRGVCMGPIAPVALHFDANGKLPVSAAGMQLTANGIPVPLVSVSSGEIVAVAPYGLDGSLSSTWSLTYKDATVSRNAVVQAAQPAIFTQNDQGYGPAAVLNEGGSPNSRTNPAAKGALVAIYATGLGQTDPPSVDGLMATPPQSQPRLSVRVTIGGQNADVLDAGLAPGFVGLSQVDVRVPPALIGQGALPLTLSAGSFTGMQNASPFVAGVTIWIGP